MNFRAFNQTQILTAVVGGNISGIAIEVGIAVIHVFKADAVIRVMALNVCCVPPLGDGTGLCINRAERDIGDTIVILDTV